MANLEYSLLRGRNPIIREYYSVLLMLMSATSHFVSFRFGLNLAYHASSMCNSNETSQLSIDSVAIRIYTTSEFIEIYSFIFLIFAFYFYYKSLWVTITGFESIVNNQPVDETRRKPIEFVVIEFVGNLLLVYMFDYLIDKQKMDKMFKEVQNACAENNAVELVDLTFQLIKFFVITRDGLILIFFIVSTVPLLIKLMVQFRKNNTAQRCNQEDSNANLLSE